MIVRVLAFVLIAAPGLWAGEYAVLSTGFRIHADSHMVAGGIVTLKTDRGVIELPTAAIQAFEVEEYVAPSSPSPAGPALLANPPAPSRPADPRELVEQAAERAGLPAALVHSVAQAESAYRIDALSPKGAIGLMQLMPGTAAALNANPYDPKQNVEAGAMYLRELLLKYRDDPAHQVTKALAAYNAGPAAVDKYNGVPPYRETIDYVNRVIADYLKRSPQP